MAGIGFELNRILARGGFTSVAQAYGYAAIVGSGPWIAAVLALGFLGTALTTLGYAQEVPLFFVAISTIYGLTLVLTGPVQLVLTRFSADRMFEEKVNAIFPAFLISMAWNSLAFAVIGLVFFIGFVEGSLLFRSTSAMLMMVVADIWVASVFLTALKDYKRVLGSFVAGCAISVLAALALVQWTGVEGALLGFAAGQCALLLMLCGAIVREFKVTRSERTETLAFAFRKYWQLALTGLFYNLGIWIDKFLFWWFDPGAEQISGVLYSAPIYDRVVYFSFLAIIPGLAVFLLRLETQFAIRTESFFQHVLRKGTLGQIEAIKREMISALRECYQLLIKVQGTFTGALVLAAPQLCHWLGLGLAQTSVFQLNLIATFLLVLFLAQLTVLSYLDKRRDILTGCTVFLAANAFITTATIVAGERWYGFGFLVASGIGTAWATAAVNRHLAALEFDTFTSQPLY